MTSANAMRLRECETLENILGRAVPRYVIRRWRGYGTRATTVVNEWKPMSMRAIIENEAVKLFQSLRKNVNAKLQCCE